MDWCWTAAARRKCSNSSVTLWPPHPDELTCLAAFITAPPAPFVPADLQLKPALAIAVCYAGSPADGEPHVQPLRTFGPPSADVIGPIPYPALQSMLDESAPSGLQNYWKSTFLDQLGDDAIDVLVDRAAAMQSPLSAIHIHHLEGAVGRVEPAATAFAHRDARFVLNLVGIWADPGESDSHIQWGPRHVRGDHSARDGRRLRQLHGRRRRRPHPRRLHPRHVRPPRGAQTHLRPRQPVSAEPEHQTCRMNR